MSGFYAQAEGRLRRPENHIIYLIDPVEVERIQQACLMGSPTYVQRDGDGVYGYILDIKPEATYVGSYFDRFSVRVTVRPTYPPPDITLKEAEAYAADALRRFNNLPLRMDEDPDMKIYEAVVLKLNDAGDPESIARVVSPFLAKNDRAAQDAVMVDYARELNLNGKDLAGYAVRVRTFQAI